MYRFVIVYNGTGKNLLIQNINKYGNFIKYILIL